MAVSNFRKFRLLLWKNYILQRRHIAQTIMELILPLVFITILVVVRVLLDPKIYEEGKTFRPFNPVSTDGNRIGENLDQSGNPFEDNRPLTVYFVPKNDQTIAIMEILKQNFLRFPDHQMVYNVSGYDSEDDLVDDYVAIRDNVLGAVIFYKTDNSFEYGLRMPSGTSWYTAQVYPTYQTLGPRDYNDDNGGQPGYYTQGFLYLQFAMDASILHYLNNSVPIGSNKIGNYEIEMQRFPYPSFRDDVFLLSMQGILPLALMLSFIYPVINTTKSIVVEKEKRLKETMKMMGLPNWMHWTAWFVKSFLFLFITTVVVVLMLKIKWKAGAAVLPNADNFVVFFFLLTYSWSAIFYCFLISSIVPKANSAAAAAGIVWFLTYIPYMFLQPRYDVMGLGSKVGMSFISNTAMSFGIRILLMYENSGAGLQWGSIIDGITPQDTFSLLEVMLLMFFDGIIYFLLAIYIEAVWPGEYGIPLPFYFPFTKSYWTGSKTDSSTTGSGSVENGHGGNNNNNSSQLIEAPPQNAKAGVQIRSLTKRFGQKVAVNGLTVDMYENQVTALLGHNGAGKTTTMSMLTGLFPPSSGTAIINNFDIRNSIKGARESLGLCPQYDVLFDEMTVEEHLEFFSLLKGCPNPKAEVDRMVKALGLEPKRHSPSHTLSGGMKRKLSVGIALVGGSKVVLLDEPTSGMDPGARRFTWDLITSEKKNRTIVLSTHFMDEADLLGDRIAIMAHGELQTVGSSLFLKKKFGGGYHLVIVKKEGCDPTKITEILRSYIGDSIDVEQDIGAELSYSLPDGKSKFFGEMFEELESRKEELNIDSYGASLTTMEEVFMKVGRAAEEKIAARDGTSKVTIENLQNDSEKYKMYEKVETNTGLKLVWQQLYAMIMKKALYSSRNFGLLAVQAGIPVIYMILVMTVLKTLPVNPKNVSLRIDIDKFYGTTTSISCVDQDSICKSYENYALSTGTSINEVADLTKYVLEESTRDIAHFNLHDMIAVEKLGNKFTAMFNNQPFHVAPAALNYLTNAFLQNFVNESVRVTTFNHPLPLSAIQSTERDFVSSLNNGFQVGFNIVFGMSFLAAGFVVFLIKERESRAKHLQFVSGAQFGVFWLANFVVDVFNYLVPVALIMIVMAAFQAETLSDPEVLVSVFVLLLFYGWAIIPQSYLFSFWFSVPATGFTRMVMINVMGGLATFLTVSLLEALGQLKNVTTALDWAFMVFPNYNLGIGISTLSRNSVLHEECSLAVNAIPGFCALPGNEENQCCTEYEIGYLAWDSPGIGRNLVFLLFIGFFSMVSVLIDDSKILHKITWPKKSPVAEVVDEKESLEDSDVAAEATRIQGADLSQLFKSENLVLRDLRKRYGSFNAVQGLSLGVKQKECFGLLGVNGAGKTTTFKMLTGDLPITSGDAFVHGYSVNKEIKGVQENLGYCPQFDAIIEELTGRETIALFARLRGVKEREIDTLVQKLGDNLLFSEHINKPVGTYSGGNKRKLSTALALIGNPPIVFLDEPTTGMDPVARRHLWNCISKVREAGTSIVLTSHSMEECEALCTRLAIMVNGQFRCLGSTQHLKSKFGEGYTVIAQLSSGSTSVKEHARRDYSQWEDELKPLKSYMEESFPGAVLKDVHPGYVHYHVTNPKLRWSYLFKKMEVAKDTFNLEAYSVGQTTLEQVFINFTKTQVSTD